MINSILFLFQHFQDASQPASFYVRFVMHQPVQDLGNFPQMEVNSIGEKLGLDDVFDNSTLLAIRRLPIDCFDSIEMWKENWKCVKNLPTINLP